VAIRVIVSFLIAALLSACTITKPNALPESMSFRQKGALYGAATGAAAGTLIGLGGPVGAMIGGMAGVLVGEDLDGQDSPRSRLYSQLHDFHVQVVDFGDKHLVVIPTSEIYYDNAPRLKWRSRPLLNLIVVYLQQFQKVDVEIAGFTDNNGTLERNMALSTDRARALLHYLTQKGIDARMMYAVGYGPARPISSNESFVGRANNSRIELTFHSIDSGPTMSKRDLNEIKRQKFFYRDSFRAMLAALYVSVLITAGLLTGIYYIYISRETPRYFATNSQSVINPLVALIRPNPASVPLLKSDRPSETGTKALREGPSDG